MCLFNAEHRINESYFKNFHRLMLVDMLYLHLTRSLNIFPDYCIYTIALIRENIDVLSFVYSFVFILSRQYESGKRLIKVTVPSISHIKCITFNWNWLPFGIFRSIISFLSTFIGFRRILSHVKCLTCFAHMTVASLWMLFPSTEKMRQKVFRMHTVE